MSREIRDIWRSGALCVAFLLVIDPVSGGLWALAQGDPADDLLACKQISDKNERLACFEEVVARLRSARDADGELGVRQRRIRVRGM